MDTFIPVQFYCEENIWKLLYSKAMPENEYYAIIISNETGCVAIFDQKSETNEDVVFWDYHVVALERNRCGSVIWDFNAKRGSPCGADDWLDVSFHANRMPVEYRPLFRVVPRKDYLDEFISDRSHMRNADGTFRKTPPPWDCIGSGENSLPKFIDMKTDNPGKVYDLYELKQFIGCPGNIGQNSF